MGLVLLLKCQHLISRGQYSISWMVTEIDGCDANISCRVLHAFYHHRLMRVFAFQLMHLSLLTDWNCSEGPLNWTASISWGFSAKFYPKVRENGRLDCNHIIYSSDFMANGQRFGMRGRRGGSNHSEQHQCHSFSPFVHRQKHMPMFLSVLVWRCLWWWCSAWSWSQQTW